MATTATLVFVGNNRLRYLVTYNGFGDTSVTITTTGGATPDILTDSIGGAIKRIAQAFDRGYGFTGPGALDQAEAQRLWLSDIFNGSPAPPTFALVAYAKCIITPRTNAIAQPWTVDADVDVDGHPTIIASMVGTPDTEIPSTVYLDIEVQNQIGV